MKKTLTLTLIALFFGVFTLSSCDRSEIREIIKVLDKET
jgi:hypothetical protein